MEETKQYQVVLLLVLAVAKFGLDIWPLALTPPSPFFSGIGLSMGLSLMSIVTAGVLMLFKHRQQDKTTPKPRNLKRVVSLCISLLDLALGLVTLVFQAFPMQRCWLAPPEPHACCPGTHSHVGIALAASTGSTLILVVLLIFIVIDTLRRISPRLPLARSCEDPQEEQYSLFWKPSNGDDGGLAAKS